MGKIDDWIDDHIDELYEFYKDAGGELGHSYHPTSGDIGI